jgi:hypothetical protein
MANAKKKGLPNVNNEGRGGAEIKKLLQQGAKEYPSLQTEANKEADFKSKKRVTKSLSMPDYVWELLFEASYKGREPQGVVVMKALKASGFVIEDADLVDGRK